MSSHRKLSAPAILLGGTTLVGLALARRIFRRTKLFTPIREAEISWNPEAYGIPGDRVEPQWISSGRHTLYGWYCRAEKPVASALLCHGKTGNITTVADIIRSLLQAHVNVLAFDYRGYGKSTGQPSIGGVIDDAVQAAKHHDELRPVALPSVIYGYSLGGAIAGEVLRRYDRFDGVVLHSTFTSLSALARIFYPNSPIHLLAGRTFETARTIRNLRQPLLIFHGDKDEVIPYRMAHDLFEACESPKTIHIVHEGQHKDLYARDSENLVKLLSSFAAGLSAETPQTRSG